MLVSTAAQADDTCIPNDADGKYEIERRRTAVVDLLPVSKLLATLEEYDQCDTLARIDKGLRLDYAENALVHAAIVMVTTIGRDPANVSASDVQKAYQLTRGMRFSSHQQALVDYAARKLSSVPENEPLFAFALSTIPQTQVAKIIETATAKVPKGPWQPPGNQPIPFYIGNQAHRMIAQYYKNAHKGEEVHLNHIPISSLLGALADNGVGPAANRDAKAIDKNALRPDITNLTTHEIYEIKPAGVESAAVAMAMKYIAVFAKAGVTMNLGRPHAPGTRGVVPAPEGHYRFYSPRPGVIVYQYKPGDYVPILAGQPEANEDEQPSLAQFERRQPVRAPAMAKSRKSRKRGFMDRMSQKTGFSGKWLIVYVILSEGSRLFPPRNLVPVP